MTTLNVIIAEDNISDVELMLRALRKSGFEPQSRVVQTEDEYRSALKDGADVILADYSLPCFSALEALRLLKESSSDIPLIVVTGAVGDEAAAECIKRGASDYLLKDRLTRLGQAVEQAVEKKRLRDGKRRAESALLESENRFQAIMDSILDDAMIIDLDGTILFANQAAAHLFQLSACDQATGRRLSDFFMSTTRDQLAKDLLRIRDGFGGFLGEYEAQTQHGANRWIEAICTRIHYRGNPAAILIFRDITEHRKMEEVLSESQERYRTLFNQMMNGFALFDAAFDKQGEIVDLIVLAVNPAFKHMTGISPDQMLGNTIRQVLPQIDSFWIESLARVAGTGEPTHFTGYLRHLDKYFEVSAFSPKKNQVAIVMADITERMNMEKSLHQTNQTLAAIFQASPVAIIALNLQGNVTVWNPGAERMFGWTESEALDQPYRAAPPDKQGEFVSLISSILRGKSFAGPETRLMKKDGTILDVSISTAPLKDAAGDIYGTMAVIDDITQSKSLEAQLSQAQKLESIGRLAGGVAHDFNNLLMVINGHSELVISQLHEQDPLRRDIEEIRKAGDRAASLTRQLLAFSRKHILQPSVLNLNTVIEDMKKMLRRLIGEHITLDIALAPDLGCVRADVSQMSQILMNLLVNAQDAMPGGGFLYVKTSNVTFSAGELADHPDASPGDYVLLEVNDTGVGMDRETKAHLFEPFFTTKEIGKGTGLGLSTVYGIVKQSSGFIKIDSEPGRGTKIRVYLPRVESGTAAAMPEIDQTARGSETILVAEDDDGVRSIILRTLENAGYTVLPARTGDEAIELCERNRSPIHLAISDMVMPTMSGRQLVQILASLCPQMKFLFISGYADDTLSDDGPLSPDKPFLQKPFTTAALAQKVRQILDQSSSDGARHG